MQNPKDLIGNPACEELIKRPPLPTRTCPISPLQPSYNLSPGGFLGSLLPLAVHTDQTARRSCQTDEPVIEAGEPERRGGDAEIRQIGNKLEVGSRTLPKTTSLA